jgi:aminobenzoyl-glutamate transport protein
VKKLYYNLILALAVAEGVLVLVSWLLSATQTEGVMSLLSSEGLRWFFGSFVSMLVSPFLVWLLLLAMAGGCLWQSGVLHMTTNGYRERVALRITLVLLLLYVLVVVALTAVPHALLLSATGRLFPSPFSHAIVPILSFGILLLSAVYGWASGRFTSWADIVDSLSWGIQRAAPLFILYVFLFQFYASLRFVFS